MQLLSEHYLWLLLCLPLFRIVWHLWGRRSVTLKNTKLETRAQARSLSARILDELIWLSKSVAYSALVLGFCGMVFVGYQSIESSNGVIWWFVDTSGSIVYPVTTENEIELANIYIKSYGILQPPAKTMVDGQEIASSLVGNPNWSADKPNRMETALGAIRKFGLEDHNMRMGLVAIDDQAFYLYPATRNHDLILDLEPRIYEYVLSHVTGDNTCGGLGIKHVDEEGGVSNDTPHLGLLPAAVSLFKNVPNNGPHIFAYWSDGDFYCDDAVKLQMKKEFEEHHIQMYVFGVGNEWKTNSQHVADMMAFLKMVGGKLILVGDKESFQKGWDDLRQAARGGVYNQKMRVNSDALLVLLAIAGGAFGLYLVLAYIRRSSL